MIDYYDDHIDVSENNVLTRYDKNGNMIFYEIDEGSEKVKYKPYGTKWEDYSKQIVKNR